MSTDMIHESGEKPESVIGHPTPGPWVGPKQGPGEANLLYIGEATGNWDICTIRIDHSPTRDQGYANARLIAAAPDMLAALHDAMIIIETVPWPEADSHGLREAFDERHKAIAAAIGKATGATS